MRKLIVIASILLLILGFSGQSMAGIHIGVNIPLPPAFVFSAPPELVVIPGTYVYYSPDVDFDLFFYGGYWYRPNEGYWYRSVSYGGPWVYAESVPSVLLRVPRDFRVITRGHRRIPYGELHRHWRAWQRGRYWERHNWGRLERETHHGLAPSFREREHQRFQGVAPRLRERRRLERETHRGLAPSFREREHQRFQGVAPHLRGRDHGGYGSRVHRGSGHEGHERP
jgi:hypothetical protein